MTSETGWNVDFKLNFSLEKIPEYRQLLFFLEK